MPSQIKRFIAAVSFALLGATPAWAGRGDVDPNYGEGGGLPIGNSVLLALPDDRLALGEWTGAGFRVRMVDAAGQNDPAFGDGGVVLIDSSDAARTFRPDTAALAPNGDMVFVGSRSDTGARALLRLDQDGQPVVSFGTGGDGFVEPALATARIAVDSDGKIVLAEWNDSPDGGCGNTRLQRLLADGQPDTGFGGDGIIEIPNLDICIAPYSSFTPVFGVRADGGVIVGDYRTIIAVDAAGDIDPTFGADGSLTATEPAWTGGLLLPDGGLLIFGSSSECSSSSDTVLRKFDRNGQPDLTYGSGTGSVTVDLGAALLGGPAAGDCVGELALDPDGEHLIANLGVSECSGIARLTIDGTPDAGFGRNGLTCLNYWLELTAVQRGGAPLFRQHADNIIYRLLPDNSPSPGFLNVVRTSRESATFGESAGTATVTVERLAGHDLAVSVNFATANQLPCHSHTYHYCDWDSATADGDYESASGRLDWAAGDDRQQAVTVRILNDDIDENLEIFGVDFSIAGGGALILADGDHASIWIADDDVTARPPPPSSPPPPSPGGGGSISWATALALLGLLLLRRRDLGRPTARIRWHEK